MTVRTEEALNINIDADITTNGANGITGAELNVILSDMVDSSVSRLGTDGTTVLNTVDVTSGVNYIEITNAAAAGSPSINVLGTDTNINLIISAKGTGLIQMNEDIDMNGSHIRLNDNTGLRDDSDNIQLNFQKVSSAVNYIEITNNAAAGSPSILAQGTDTNINLVLGSKGSGTVLLTSSNLDINGGNILFNDNTGIVDSGGDELLWFQESSTPVNFIEINNANTTNSPGINGTGSDANVTLDITSKGTASGSGVQVQSNGSGRLGFYATPPILQQTVSGARDEVEGAMVSLLDTLELLGIIVDGTTAS